MTVETRDALDRLLLATAAFVGGMGVGMLLAPTSGAHARRRLSEGAREAAEAARVQAREAAEPLADRVRTATADLAERHVPLADSDWEIVDGRDLVRDLPGAPRR